MQTAPVKLLVVTLLSLLNIIFTGQTAAHGSVVAENDLCIINIDFFQAHFKIYQPVKYQHRDFCEDLPGSGETVFILEYIHGELGSVPMDFRVIRNTTGLGTYTKMSDIEAINNIDEITVFYQPPEKHLDIFTVMYDFSDRGEYLGIVTAENTSSGEIYSAVFPFEVGYTRLGKLPLFVILLSGIQGVYWFWSRKRKSLIHTHE